MNINDAKNITNKLLKTFLEAGNLSLELRKKGLKKEIKKDNTPVTNADLEIDNMQYKVPIFLLTKKVENISKQDLYDGLFFYERDVLQHLFFLGKSYPIDMRIQVQQDVRKLLRLMLLLQSHHRQQQPPP